MKRRTLRLGTYALSLFVLLNSVWITVYPTLSYADSYQIVDGKLVVPDNKEQMEALTNEGNWDGALFIKGFKMPEVKKGDVPPGYDPETGEYTSDPSLFTDSTENRLKNEVYLQQLFPDYSEDTLNNYLDDIKIYESEPYLINDDMVSLQDSIALYRGVNCETLPTTSKQKECKKTQLLTSMEDMKNNQGKSLFAGAGDSIIASTTELVDGNHPYYSELFSEECKQITKPGEEGIANVLTETRVCTTSSVDFASCRAERFMETEFVETKVIMKPQGVQEITLLRSGYDDSDIEIIPCPGEEDTCLQVTTRDHPKTGKDVPTFFNGELVFDAPYVPGQATGFFVDVNGFEFQFPEHLKVTSGKVVETGTQVALDHSPVEYSMDALPEDVFNNLGLMQTVSTIHGKVFERKPDIPPPCQIQNKEAPDLLTITYGVSEYGTYPVADGNYCASKINPYTTPTPHQDNSRWLSSYDNVLSVETRFPSYFPSSGTHHPLQPWLMAWYTNAEFHLYTRYHIYYEEVKIDNGVINAIRHAIVDESEQYPKNTNLNINGEQIPITIDVFDIETYPANKFIPTNIQVIGDSVESFELLTIGRATNQWQYEVSINFSSPGPFEITADMHRIVDEGIRPVEGEDYCQPVIDTFIESTYPGTAVCEDTLGTRTNAQGVVFDEAHRGYLKLMRSWGENGQPPLDEMCWEATLEVDSTSGVGISEDDKTLTCAGLKGKDYDDCMAGQWCTYDDINGEEVCTDTSNGLMSSFEDSCARYINDPTCTYDPEQTTCEEWFEDAQGDRSCLYESHFFKCEVDTNGYSIPTYADEVENICGGILPCAGGECTNIKKETNDAFAEAAVMSELATEMKRAKNCAIKADPSTCKLFEGEIAECGQPKVWGSSDCCDPDAMGMGGIDVFKTLQAMRYLEAATETEVAGGWMTQAWTATTGYVGGTEVGQAMGSAFKTVTEPVTNAYTTMTDSIQTGFNNFIKNLGFDPITTEGAQTGINAAWNSTLDLGINSITNDAITSTFGNGMMQYIAQGVYDFIAQFAPAIADAIFATAASGTSGTVVTGFANELANEVVALILEWFSVVMLIYSIYMLVVGVVFGCKEHDYKTTNKIKLLSNHYVGTYCGRKSLFGGCFEHVQTHCVYGSPFSRIMAEQIKIQKAEQEGVTVQDYWINPEFRKTKTPDCSGYSIEELASINWDRVDLTEFLQITMGVMKYNPNNMPEDFIYSEVEAGGRTGPQAGITAKESNLGALTSVAKAADFNRNTITAHNTQLTDPDYMPWYEAADGDGSTCSINCDSGYLYNSASGLCELTQRTAVAGTKSCNTEDGYGYDSFKDMCVKIESKPMEAGCPVAYVENEETGMCVATTYVNEEADIECPLGTKYNSSENMCQNVEVIDTIKDCSIHGIGYVLKEGLCVLEYIADVPPVKVCPNTNYTLVGDICVYSSTQPYQISCPAGEHYDPFTNTCFIVSANYTPASKDCPSGMSLEGNACVKKETETPNLICDTANGWTLVGNQCEKSETISIEPGLACPEGYFPSKDNSGCIKYNLAESDTPTCPSGWDLVNNGYCIREVVQTQPASFGCNIGFSFDGTECKRVLKYAPMASCDTDAGYKYNGNGQCIKVDIDTVSANKTCSEGTLVGDYCHIPTSEVAGLRCPLNYVLSDDKTVCTLTETIITPVIVDCPVGFSPSGVQCVKYISAPPTEECPIGSSVSDDGALCLQVIDIVQPPEMYCPDNFSLIAGECIGREVIQATATCDDPEYTYDPLDKKCFKDSIEYVEAAQLCAPGSEEEIEGNCKSSVTKPAINDCPLGFHYSLEAATCVSEVAEFIDAILECESGWSYDEILKICVHEDIITGVACEDGFTFNETLGQCEKTITTTATPYCEDGYAFDGASCVRAVHTEYTCDIGYTYSSDTKACERNESTAPTQECETGFVLSGDICVLDNSVAPDCEDGFSYEPSSNLCKRISPLPTENSCSAPYYDEGAGCARLLTDTIQCPDGMIYREEEQRCVGDDGDGPIYPVENYCPVGVDSGTDCRVKEQKMPDCEEEGFHYDTELQKCKKEVTVEGTPYCQADHLYNVVLAEDRCAYYSTKAPMENGDCEATYKPDEQGQCIRYELFEEPFYACPLGYINAPDADGHSQLTSPLCVKNELMTAVCDTENDYTFVDGFCEKYHKKPYSQRCIVEGEYQYGEACLSGPVSSIECQSGYAYSKDHHRCEFIEFIAYSQVCPDAYSLIGDQCVSSETSSPSCPNNHTLNPSTDMCEPDNLDPVCPAGYTYNATLDKCEFREEIDAEASCPPESYDTGSGCKAFDEARCNDGFTLDKDLDKCIKEDTIAATPSCPEGQYDTGTGCRAYEDATCAGGYTLNPETEMCEKPDSIAGQPYCPTGYRDTGTGCVHQMQPSCETDGYVFDDETGKCLKEETISAIETCPEGSRDVGDGCQAYSIPTCPNNYTFIVENDRCEYLQSIPATGICYDGYDTGFGCGTLQTTNPSCPNGYTPNGNANCVKTLYQQPNCSNGYSYNSASNKCEKQIESTPTCNPGFNWDSNLKSCIKTQPKGNSCPPIDGINGVYSGGQCTYTQNIIASCPAGWSTSNTSGGKQCTFSQPANGSCPAGYDNSPYQSGKCYKQHNPNCNFGYSYNTSTNKCEKATQHTPNCPGGYSYNAVSKICEKITSTTYGCPPLPPAILTVNNVKQRCYYKYTISSGQSCMSGFTKNPVAYPPYCERNVKWSHYCTQGVKSGSQCILTANSWCNNGYSLVGSYCVKTLQQTPTCNSGYTFYSPADKCLKHVEQSLTCPPKDGISGSLVGSTCNYSQTVSAGGCPLGWSSSNISGGVKCTKTTTASQDPCPFGWLNHPTNNSLCYQTGNINCSPGTYDSQLGKCTSTSQLTPTCNSGYSWVANLDKCVKYTYASYICPNGYGYNSSTALCEKVTTGDIYDEWECPNTVPPYTLSGDTCERTLVSLPICAPGQTYDDQANECISPTNNYELGCPIDEPPWVLSGSICVRMAIGSENCDAGYSFNSTENRCEKDIEDPFSFECPDATPPYSVDGDTCERILESEAQCNDPYAYNNERDRCEAPEEDYGLECPENWTLIGEFCERTFQHDPICDAGFTYNTISDRCEADIDSGYEYSCQDGYTLDGTICFKYLYDDPDCTADYVFENDVCRPYEERSTVNTCAEGWEETEGMCTRSSEKAPNCSGDYRFSPQADECTKFETAIVGFQCPDSYTVVGDTCEFLATDGNSLDCELGYSFNMETNECSRIQYAYPIHLCPVGYEQLEDNRTCRKIVPDTAEPIGLSCPYTGFELIDGECVLTYSVDMSHYCEDSSYELVPYEDTIDFVTDEPFVCERTVRYFQEPSRSCPTDYEVYAIDYCTKQLSQEPSLTCPQGLIPADDGSTNCTGEITIEVPFVLSCESPYKQVGAFCTDTQFATASLSCASNNATIIEGTCRESVVVDTTLPTYSCPTMDDPNDGYCNDYVMALPDYSCPDSTYDLIPSLGICQKETLLTDTVSYSCPSGTSLIRTECVKTETHAGHVSCPTSAWSLEGSTCTRTVNETRVADICLSGDVFRFNACYTPEYHEFIDGCANGQTMNISTNMCEYVGVIYDSPVVTCPSADFKPVGLTCKKETSANIIYSCPDITYTLVGSQCYEEIISTASTPEFGCPVDFIDSGSQCEYNDSDQVEISCPELFYYNDALDVCQTDEVDKKAVNPICPDGYDKVDEFKCRKLLSSLSPAYDCIPPAQLDGTMCRTLVNIEEPPGYCEPPYSRVRDMCYLTLTDAYDLSCPEGSETQFDGCFLITKDTRMAIEVCD